MRIKQRPVLFVCAVFAAGVCLFALLPNSRDLDDYMIGSLLTDTGDSIRTKDSEKLQTQKADPEMLDDGRVGEYSDIATQLVAADPQPEPKLVSDFFESWLKVDPIAATKAALEFPGRFRLNQLKVFSIEYNRLLQSNPDLAVEMLIVSKGRLGDFLLYQGMPRPLQDPELEDLNKAPNFDALKMAAEEFAKKVGGISASRAAQKLVGQYTTFLAAQHSFDEVREWTQTLDDKSQKVALRSLFSATKDRLEVLNYLEFATTEIVHEVGMNYVIATSEDDPSASIEWLSENAGVFSVNPNYSVLSRWLLSDPEAAKKYVDSVENPQLRKLAATAVAQTLSKNSVDEALNWVKEWPDERQEMLDSTISYAIQFGSEEIINYLRNHPDQNFSAEIEDSVRSQLSKEIGRNRALLEEVLTKMKQ